MGIKVNLSDICFPSAGFVCSVIGGNLVIVPLVKGIADLDRQIYTVSETGFAIWQKLDGKRSLGQVAAELAKQFSCPLKEIERDTLGIVDELMQRGICEKLNSRQVRLKQIKCDAFYKAGEISKPVKHSDGSAVGTEPESYVTSGGELSLSNPGQLALLESMAERGLPLRTSVRGYSMHPFIRDRDVLTIAPFKGHHPELGDVVAFTHPGNNRLVIHRIIANTASGCLIKGDNCAEADGIIEPKKIVGYVTRIERDAKEVRFGFGNEKKLIAFLNRGGALIRLKKLRHLLRRIVMHKTLRCSDD